MFRKFVAYIMGPYMLINNPIDIYFNMLVIIVVLIALAIDMRIYKIPNLLTYPAMSAALLLHTALNGTSGLLFSLLGLLAGLGLFFLPFSLGFMGAGDVKLMGAVGAALGARGVLNACIFTSLAGGLLAVALLVFHNRNITCLSGYVEALKASIGERRVICVPSSAAEKKPKVYYALAIAAGTIYSICWKAAFSRFPL
jgi:prepilin peptidase CpaA